MDEKTIKVQKVDHSSRLPLKQPPVSFESPPPFPYPGLHPSRHGFGSQTEEGERVTDPNGLSQVAVGLREPGARAAL